MLPAKFSHLSLSVGAQKVRLNRHFGSNALSIKISKELKAKRREIRSVVKLLDENTKSINDVQSASDDVTKSLRDIYESILSTHLTTEDKRHWREKEKRLDEEKSQLREEKKRLDEKEKRLDEKKSQLDEKKSQLIKDKQNISFSTPEVITNASDFQFTLGSTSTSLLTGNSVVEMLMSDRFVDKTDGYHRLLNRAVGSDGVFTGEIIVFIFCRRFGKTTFLRFIEALLNPLPIFKTKRQAEIRKKISSYSKGLELLKLGVYPVVMLDFSTPPNVRTLVSSIRTSLIDAGLAEQEADQICAATGVSAQKILNNGCAALNTQFEKELGYSNRKAVLLIDEYDGAHRKDDLNCGTHQKNELKELREAVVDILALSKDPSSSVGLMVVAGLTRMVGSGLSRVNTLAYGDVSKYTDYHGVCGILQTELVKSAGKGIDVEKKCLARFGKGLDDVLTALSARWNGFRFGYMHLGIETANKPLDSLFSPLDMWALLVEINKGAVEPEHHEDTLLNLLRLPSEWTSSMSSEFEFTNIQNI